MLLLLSNNRSYETSKQQILPFKIQGETKSVPSFYKKLKTNPFCVIHPIQIKDHIVKDKRNITKDVIGKFTKEKFQCSGYDRVYDADRT